MRKIFLMMLALFLCVGVQAQENQYLRELTEAVKGLRRGNDKVRRQFETSLSSSGKPKIALMDDVNSEGDEFKGNDANQFRLNQAVVNVYDRQNHTLMSKDGGMLSSKERGIYYSAIEKSIKKGGTITCSFTGHIGQQEVAVISYHPTAKFKVTISDGWHNPVTKEGVGTVSVESYRVLRNNTVTITIEYVGDSSNKDSFDSFAIVNYNPQKR